MGWLVMLNLINKKLRLLKLGPLLGCALLAATQPAHAFKLSPIVMDFAPSGREANQSFRVENDSEQRVAIQISMLKRDMELDGKEINSDGDNDFIVHPTQILLEPKSTQTIRIKWIGERNSDKELAYRIVAEQLPVNLTKEKQTGAKIDILVRYLGSVYIVPKGAKSEVVLDSISEQQANETNQLIMVLHNRGSTHTVLRDLRFKFQAGGKTIELGPEELKGIAGENILAGKKRQFTLPRPVGLPNGAVKATFEFKRRGTDLPK